MLVYNAQDNLSSHFKAKHSIHNVVDLTLLISLSGTPSISNLNPRKQPCIICGKEITPKNKAKHMKINMLMVKNIDRL